MHMGRGMIIRGNRRHPRLVPEDSQSQIAVLFISDTVIWINDAGPGAVVDPANLGMSLVNSIQTHPRTCPSGKKVVNGVWGFGSCLRRVDWEGKDVG